VLFTTHVSRRFVGVQPAKLRGSPRFSTRRPEKNIVRRRRGASRSFKAAAEGLRCAGLAGARGGPARRLISGFVACPPLSDHPYRHAVATVGPRTLGLVVAVAVPVVNWLSTDATVRQTVLLMWKGCGLASFSIILAPPAFAVRLTQPLPASNWEP